MKVITLPRLLALLITFAVTGSLQASLVTFKGNNMTVHRGHVDTSTGQSVEANETLQFQGRDDSINFTDLDAQGNTTVAALSGQVTVKLANGQSVTIDAGTGVVISSTGFASAPTSLSSLVKSNPALATNLVAAVTDVAKLAGSTPAALTQLALVVKVVATAVPEQATTIVRNAVSGLGSAGTVTGETLNQAVGAVVQATAQGSGATVAALTAAATTVPGVTVTPTTDTQVLNEILDPVTPVETPVINLPASPS